MHRRRISAAGQRGGTSSGRWKVGRRGLSLPLSCPRVPALSPLCPRPPYAAPRGPGTRANAGDSAALAAAVPVSPAAAARCQVAVAPRRASSRPGPPGGRLPSLAHGLPSLRPRLPSIGRQGRSARRAPVPCLVNRAGVAGRRAKGEPPRRRPRPRRHPAEAGHWRWRPRSPLPGEHRQQLHAAHRRCRPATAPAARRPRPAMAGQS